ncbi:hypothetical protein MIT9_P1289 [Methylomarinovum caldicuralii]|uniref:Uncharacterized protein n=1 Tax=Methylomarinovum caldicuralii TaxID=438856 RepID=A0AAU9C8D9_9GAMM|nr:hypothetical protein [Methylomarinovum caldicuralii]BCX81711.1 hypothetical protein MIT9_P1289 [Methylomarinovum caldicuralii]
MQHQLKRLVQSFHGYTYEMAGMLAAFFDDPQEARACAERITREWQRPVEVNGTSIVILL